MVKGTKEESEEGLVEHRREWYRLSYVIGDLRYNVGNSGGGGTGGEDKLSSALMPECKGLRWIQLMEFKTEPEEEFEGGI